MKRTRMYGLGAAVILAAAVLANGQEAAPAALVHTFTLGATMTDGNSDTRMANASWLTEGEREGLGSVRLGVEGNYGESRDSAGAMDTTVENVKAFLNVKKTLSALTFTYVDATYLFDDIALVDYRFTLGPGLGAYLVKREATQVSVDVGPSYVWEEVDGDRDEYLALRVAQRAEHKFATGARIWESVEYLPSTEAFSEYLLTSEAGVEAPISAKLNVRLVVQNKYDSEPAPGKDRSDTTAIAGVSIKL